MSGAAAIQADGRARERARITATIDTEMNGLAAMRAALAEGLAEAFLAAADAIEQSGGAVIVTGMGKSGHIGRKIAATLASTGTRAHFVHPAEASHGDLGMIAPRDVVLALSWSGEAPELANLITYTRRFGNRLIALTSRPGSALGKAADIGLYLPAAEEACPNGLAPTTSTTMQLVAGDVLAMVLLERRGFSAKDFRRYHPGGRLGAQLLSVGQLMHKGEEVPLVREGMALSDGIVEMTSKRFGIAAVVDEAGALVGVLTDGDLRRAFQGGFRDMKVDEAMGRRQPPQTITADALAAEALARMSDASITCMFVVEAGRPVGVLHIHDLLRAGVA
ncbi:SIS domain-containing protein [Acidocella sp.]|uniref:KpsF/GutQ family sugar-phosphate isomerase n=1 Tax=Acidocella sp. TaxID=50710 RepID=UPI0026227750|nr:KpsF/GutQ family sugar-phosphate isomerase [Acidocella sp.]